MRTVAIWIGVLLLAGAAHGQGREALRARFLTGPQSGDPLEIALAYLEHGGSAAGGGGSGRAREILQRSRR